ncbi:MAG: CPXCG motif-containing cysteine-rich protein [Gammaproteobacteria bacterium]|jgi:transcription elongation factor Elf1
MPEDIIVDCPYCGEQFETIVDISGGDQRYIEDCAVCCRPIEFQIRVDARGELREVKTFSQDD